MVRFAPSRLRMGAATPAPRTAAVENHVDIESTIANASTASSRQRRGSASTEVGFARTTGRRIDGYGFVISIVIRPVACNEQNPSRVAASEKRFSSR